MRIQGAWAESKNTPTIEKKETKVGLVGSIKKHKRK